MEADLAEAPPAATNGHAADAAADEAKVLDEKSQQIATLLGKGQTLLNLEKTAEALRCFDEVLALDAANAEALVKKGTVLERQGKVDEAIAYYDRAIASDNSMTMAYLCKGGVFNRLERYGEALECYEQALRTKEKSHAAT
jgi:tetratricopeptide (TPR) repeat protein